MPWQDRVKEAAYTPVGGDRLTFDFEDVSEGFTLRGRAFDFPDADGTFVQRTGSSSRRYPLRVIFWGDDHDLEASAFEAALIVPGVGSLEHPFYGTIAAVPFGDVGRRDDLVTAANQTVIEVTFWATIGSVYPTPQTDPAATVLAAVAEFNAQAATEFDDTTDLDDAVEQATFKNVYQRILDSAVAGLQPIANTQDDVREQFDAVKDSINQSIDILIQDPLTLASQTLILLEAPSRAQLAIADRLAAYSALAGVLINTVQEPGLDATSSNTFHTADLYASTYVAGAVLSVVNNEFETRTDALAAAEALLTFMGDVTAWRDDNYVSLDETDTGGQYQQLQEAVALAAGFLVQISFTLKQERTFILTRNRTPIDLCAELYGEVDAVLDFFADSNSFSWQEHLEIQRGRSIVYYV